MRYAYSWSYSAYSSARSLVIKNATNSRALNGLRNPHRNSLPGPVSEMPNRITDVVMNPFATVFIVQFDFFMSTASVRHGFAAPHLLFSNPPFLPPCLTDLSELLSCANDWDE